MPYKKAIPIDEPYQEPKPLRVRDPGLSRAIPMPLFAEPAPDLTKLQHLHSVGDRVKFVADGRAGRVEGVDNGVHIWVKLDSGHLVEANKSEVVPFDWEESAPEADDGEKAFRAGAKVRDIQLGRDGTLTGQSDGMYKIVYSDGTDGEIQIARASEFLRLSAKLADAKEQLAKLEAEKLQMARSVAEGKLEIDVVGELTDKVGRVQTVISGLTMLIQERDAALEKLYPELRQLERADAENKLREEIEGLRAAGTVVAERIDVKIMAILKDDLPAYDRICDKLRKLSGNPEFPVSDPLVSTALDSIGKVLFSGADMPLAAQKLLKEGWKVRGSVRIAVANLWPPKT